MVHYINCFNNLSLFANIVSLIKFCWCRNFVSSVIRALRNSSAKWWKLFTSGTWVVNEIVALTVQHQGKNRSCVSSMLNYWSFIWRLSLMLEEYVFRCTSIYVCRYPRTQLTVNWHQVGKLWHSVLFLIDCCQLWNFGLLWYVKLKIRASIYHFIHSPSDNISTM